MEFYFSKIKPKKCPKCGSKEVAVILWGFQIFSPKLEREMQEGKLVLGGCCVTDCDPSWKCTKCSAYIYRERLREILRVKTPFPFNESP
jgi:hypothetical protein